MRKRASELGDYPVRVLVVDDEPSQRQLERAILAEPGYEVFEAENGAAAIAAVKEHEFDVMLLDRLMPDMNGDEVCRQIRDEQGMHLLPIIMVSGDVPSRIYSNSLNGYANDFISKPYTPEELLARVNSAAIMKRRMDDLEDVEEILLTLARMVEAKDKNTGGHCARLIHACTVFGELLGLGGDDIASLRRGSVLHDIGKMGIPDHILLKKGPLSDNEMAVMKTHTIIGYELCRGLKSLKSTLPIIRNHHERYDGTGYPDGLGGEDIPLLARVFQIVDVYDALAYPRAYKSALSNDRVIELIELETEKGWWDPDLVSVFLSIVRNRPDDLLCDD